AHRGRDGEDFVHGRPALQRALRGGLNDRAVGDWIGERHAELDGVRAGIGEREDDVGRRSVAASDVGDEAAAFLRLQRLEETFNTIHLFVLSLSRAQRGISGTTARSWQSKRGVTDGPALTRGINEEP